MGRIKNSNFYVINGWMVNDLGLSGRELQVYAIIYGFTQDEETEFNGSLNYIAEWLGTSNRVTVTRAINGLINKGLITKRQIIKKGVKTNFYKAILPYPKLTKKGSTETVQGIVPKQYRGSTKMVQGVSTKTVQGVSTVSVPNIYINNNTHIDKDNLLVEEADKDHIPYSKIKELFNKTCVSLSRVITISPNRKKAIAARWKEYGGNIETFEKLFTMTEESEFLKGKNERHWTATFDWLMKPNNMTKVLEGNYRNKGTSTKLNKPVENRAMTTEELEEKLRQEGSFKGYPDFYKMFGNNNNERNETNGNNG